MMLAYFTRHGQTEYKQGKINLAEANDLLPEGIERVVSTASEASDHMKSLGINNIRIKSSPYGRTLHTAKLWHEVLRVKRLDVGDVEICPELEEVKNFIDYAQYLAFVNGGSINLCEVDCFIDASMTNLLCCMISAT